MIKSSLVGWVVAAALVSACTVEIGGILTDESGGQEPELRATLSVSDGWRSIEASEPAFDTLEFELMARPGAAGIDAGIALGGRDITGSADAPINVRFARDGIIEAQNGVTWDNEATIHYEPEVWYRIVISADLVAQTY